MEKAIVQVAFGLTFACDWLRGWLHFSGPNTANGSENKVNLV